MNIVCPQCKLEKEPTEFYSWISKTGKPQRSSWCKECGRCHTRSWVSNNREKKREQDRKYASGATPEGLRKFKEDCQTQEGRCAICGEVGYHKRTQQLIYDHDHNTGAYRGALCSSCNRGLGNFKDKIALLQRAIEYLKTK